MKRFISLATLMVLLVCKINAAEVRVLRVGLAPTSPPIQFWDRNTLSGLEVDFANKIGEEMGWKIELVDLKFRKLIPALLNKDIDVIMAGMSVTKVRDMQVSFATPYMKIGQMPLVRMEDQKKFIMPLDIILTDKKVGATENTTSEYLVVQDFTNARKTLFADQNAAVNALKKKRIDMLILDSPYIMWLAMQNEGQLAPVPIYLTEENIAWAVRKDDKALLESLNVLLAKWSETGQLSTMINKRIPVFK